MIEKANLGLGVVKKVHSVSKSIWFWYSSVDMPHQFIVSP